MARVSLITVNELARHPANPLVSPQAEIPWLAQGTYNPCIVAHGDAYHLVFEAKGKETELNGHKFSLSTIGYAKSQDGIRFELPKSLVTPDFEWEKYGCKDPHITYIEGDCFIFYTALSNWPPSLVDTKIGVVTTKDFSSISEKHLVTPFNSSAMALFPRRISDRLTAILTVHTDMPPTKIAVASFRNKEEIWSPEYWLDWYQNLEAHTVPLQRMKHDRVEVGAPPIETDEGWLLIYTYIKDYSLPDKREFRVEAVMLDRDAPQLVIGRLEEPLIVPKAEYELKSKVDNVIFPSGAIVEGGQFKLYYGAAESYSCLAAMPLSEILARIRRHRQDIPKLRRLGGPILKADSNHYWEAKAVLNPAAVYEAGKVHLLYRAVAPDNTSVLGYANSQDGYHIDERLNDPVYLPKIEAELKKRPNSNSGVEDPRLTRLDDKFYMTYTAQDGLNPPRVALTSIAVEDFLNQSWHWQKPILISAPDIDNKDASLLPEKINGKYVMFHRQRNTIHLDYLDNLNFDGETFLKGEVSIPVRPETWDALKIGICAPPIKCDQGWLLLYHGISVFHREYRVGAMLLDHNNPAKVLARTPNALLEPETDYERHGLISNVIFPCGAVVINNNLFVYYGAADQVISVAAIELSQLLNYLEELHHPQYFG